MMADLCSLVAFTLLTLFAIVHSFPLPEEACPEYGEFAKQQHPEKLSPGRHQLPYQRPPPPCRTFYSKDLEDTIFRLESTIADPDLFRLFENTYPNTLDTAVKWTGYAWTDEAGSAFSDEELAFIITGDMYGKISQDNVKANKNSNAMWLRDSANQILSYLPLLQFSSSAGSIASLFRGVINIQSRYIKISPYCHAFQPPAESNITLQRNFAYTRNKVHPPYNQSLTFDCKWELDSLASFLQLSSEYYNSTGDIDPFSKYKWVDTVEVILQAVEAMRTGTYTPDGHIAPSGYTMTGQTDRATETTSNNGLGNPIKAGTGLVRSTFRPSDDATIFQFLIPSNMMFARYLESAALIMNNLQTKRSSSLAVEMREMASSIRAGISKYGVISHPLFGAMYAFEVDGYGSQNIMDDANLPSLLSASLMGYVSPRHEVYLNTRLFALSEENPYWMHGEVISAIGGPHNGPTKAWPLAGIVRILTSENGDEIREELRGLLGSTDGLGKLGSFVLMI